MKTRVVNVSAASLNSAAIAEAVEVLRQGGLVAFPTETVYGLGADARNETAVKRVFDVKGRPADNPLIVHIADLPQLQEVAIHVTPQAQLLAKTFWPGPLTLVLMRAPAIPGLVSTNLDTVAVRMPDHPAALSLIKSFGAPIVGPSANLSGRPSPTRAEHVLADLDGAIEMILDAGPTPIGLESTILDVTVDPPVILRLGGLAREQIEAVIGRTATTADPHFLKRSPGTHHRHYAPRARVVLVDEGDREGLRAIAEKFSGQGYSLGCIVHSIDTVGLETQSCSFVKVTGAEELSRRLYGMLREMDGLRVQVIIVESVRREGIGAAVMDRLTRASAATVEEDIRMHQD